MRACSRINSFTRASVSARSLVSMRLSASILRPPVLTADAILVFCLLLVFVVFEGLVFVRVFICESRLHFLISALIVPRATFAENERTQYSFRARFESSSFIYGNCFILVASSDVTAPRTAAV